MRPILAFIVVASVTFGQQTETYLSAAHKAEASADFRTAEIEYRRALRAHADSNTYLRLGLVCHLQNRFHEAISAFKSSLRLQPDQWSARLFLGIDLYRTNRFADARNELEYANRLKPGDYEVRFWQGATQLALKQYFQGFQTLEDLSRERPNDREVLRLLAENYASFGAALLNRVAENYPDTPEGMLVHAHALEFEGAGEAALDVYETIEKKWPDRDGVREAIGRLKAGSSLRRRPSPEAVGGASPFQQ